MSVSEQQANRIIFTLALTVLLLLGVLLYTASPWAKSGNVVQTEAAQIINLEELKAPSSPFLESEEIVVVAATSTDAKPLLLPVEKVLFEYVEVTDGCGPFFQGECLRVRSGPGMEYPVVSRLRNGIVLKVGGQVIHDEVVWYKIVFDEWLRYPERVKSDWYVAADFVTVLLDEGDRTIWEDDYSTSSQKVITVDRSEQMLYAFDGNDLFMETSISTGLELTPTPQGTFTVFKKTPSRYMQGPLPNLADRSYYDLPGVPWNLYFTHQGAVIHGAYWHDSFGSQYSHGCVNLVPNVARDLYNWADLGTTVIVKD
jgi:hypothetical protein